METIEFTAYDDEGDEFIVALPAKFEVCGVCDGRGQHSRALGAFTSEDFDELGDDFRDNYFAGNYDKRCEGCNGERVQLVPDVELATQTDLDLYYSELEADAMYARERAHEMRMGY